MPASETPYGSGDKMGRGGGSNAFSPIRLGDEVIREHEAQLDCALLTMVGAN
jgi:hypothetical protein